MGNAWLGVIRLSRETEESTSPLRQRQIIEQWASARGDKIIGWAEDLGVSATVDPWDRPQLGPWLAGEREQFDGIVAWRVDRLARRVLHFARLLDWAGESKRQIASATEGFDLSTPIGRMFAQLIAMLAEGELEAIKERTKASYDHLVSVGRHRGGFLPYGYRSIPNPNGNGYVLEIDTDAQGQILAVVDDVLDGKSINSIVAALNANHVPSPLAVQRLAAGKSAASPKTGREPMWRVGSISKLLRSDTLLGFLSPDPRSASGVPVDDSGRRVRRAEPILTQARWDELQAELNKRDGVRGPRERWGAAMLLRVAHCGHDGGDGICGQRMYTVENRAHRYYRCSSKSIGGSACGGGGIRASVLEAIVTDAFLDKLGDKNVMRRVYVAGEDHSSEIRETEDALGRLARRLERVPDGPAADAVYARMAEHTDHLQRLRRLPARAAGWTLEPTGETYGHLWSRLDQQLRGKLLRDTGVHVTVHTTRPLSIGIDLGDLENLEAEAVKSAAAITTA